MPPVPSRTEKAAAAGAALASKLFGGGRDENAPTTEEEVMEMVGFDHAKLKDYTNHEMTVMAKKAQKLCKKYRIGEYAPGGGKEAEAGGS